MNRRSFLAEVSAFALLASPASALRGGLSTGVAAAGPVVSQMVNDGMTAWFAGPRAIMAGGAMFHASVSGTASGGNVELSRVQGGVRDTWLQAGELEVDDHDDGCLLHDDGSAGVGGSGKIVHFYGLHTDNAGTRYRVSDNSAPNIGGFGLEHYVPETFPGISASYGHAFILNDGNVYLFRRYNDDAGHTIAVGRKQEMLVAPLANVLNGTATWTSTILLYTANQRPYAVYVRNGVDRVDIFTSRASPGEISSACPVYHLYMQLVAGTPTFFLSDGTQILTSPPFECATVLTGSSIVKNSTTSTDMCWTNEIRIGPDNFPRVTFFRYPSPSTGVLRHDGEYWWARWTGSAWSDLQVSSGNTALYAAQNSYMPGLCFDGDDVTILYMSENKDGGTGTLPAEMRKYQLNEAVPSLSGVLATITSASAHNNVRPFSPIGADAANTVLWATGIYNTYTDYEMDLYVWGNVSIVNRFADPGAYEAETTTLLAAMSVQPSHQEKNIIDRRIKRAKSGATSGTNFWAKYARFYMPQTHDAQAALLDWTRQGDLTVTGSPTFTAFQGIKGTTLTTDYYAGQAPNALGSNFTQNSAYIKGFYAKLTGAGGAVMRRTASGPPVFLASSGSGANSLIRVNASVGFTTPNTNNPSTVWHVGNRTGASAVDYYRDGGLINSNTDASVALDSAVLAFAFQQTGYLRAMALGLKFASLNEVADEFFADWEYCRDYRS